MGMALDAFETGHSTARQRSKFAKPLRNTSKLTIRILQRATGQLSAEDWHTKFRAVRMMKLSSTTKLSKYSGLLMALAAWAVESVRVVRPKKQDPVRGRQL
jgi:hypothetical protein